MLYVFVCVYAYTDIHILLYASPRYMQGSSREWFSSCYLPAISESQVRQSLYFTENQPHRVSAFFLTHLSQGHLEIQFAFLRKGTHSHLCRTINTGTRSLREEQILKINYKLLDVNLPKELRASSTKSSTRGTVFPRRCSTHSTTKSQNNDFFILQAVCLESIHPLKAAFPHPLQGNRTTSWAWMPKLKTVRFTPS